MSSPSTRTPKTRRRVSGGAPGAECTHSMWKATASPGLRSQASTVCASGLAATSAAGAARETWEEAAAKAVDLELYRIFDVPHISQVYLFYRCGIENDEFGVGPESLESALYTEQEIPWDELAFPTVRELLREFLEDRKTGQYPVRNTVIEYPRR